MILKRSYSPIASESRSIVTIGFLHMEERDRGQKQKYLVLYLEPSGEKNARSQKSIERVRRETIGVLKDFGLYQNCRRIVNSK